MPMQVDIHNANNSIKQDGARKRGRKELRTIKRTTAKKPKFEENTEDAVEEESEDDGENSEPLKNSDDDDDGEDDERKKKVYGALLTILKSEHPDLKKKNKKRQLKTNVPDEEGEEEEMIEENEDEQIDTALEKFAVDEDVEEEAGDEEDVDSEDEKDPFESHLNQLPEADVDKLDNCFKNKQIKYRSIKNTISERESAIYSRPVDINITNMKVESPVLKSSIHSYFLKQRLKMHNDLMDPEQNSLTPLQKSLVDPMFQYKDILYEYEQYGKDEDEYRDLYVLHALNHVYKTRDRILKDNQRLQENKDGEYLDQGFTRAKVLIVTPTRDTGYQVIDRIITKSGIDQVDKKGKFKDQFLDESLPPSSKPKSFQHIFKGNTNDFFVLGMKFTRKAIKLYSNFYQSDIIVCSPLGLQMILENTDKKKRQDDFLSSIEITIIDQLHSIEYQNISHVFTIFDHLNTIPKEQHDADFSRIRMWYINEQAKLFRQTMIFTKYISPTANSLLNKCRNWEGRWKNHRMIESEDSAIGKLGLRVRQIFQRFDVMGGSIIDEPDYRFKYFTSVIIPGIEKSPGYEDGILVYIPDYTDYIRVRNYMKDKTSLLFGDINEYSEQRQLTANRTIFSQGRVKILLYTERLHHYRRYEIRGVKSVVFYKPPSNPEFYNEVVRYIGKNAFLGNSDLNISTVRCVYSKLDALNLERIVGSKRAAVLTHAQNETYEFK